LRPAAISFYEYRVVPDSVPNSLPLAFAFGRFALDRKRRLLLADGETVKLQARAFDILECLIERRQRPVSRDEIMTQVWRGQIVAETNLTVQMSNLRKALDEYGGSNLIVTINRSYQFVGDVTELPLASPPAPPSAVDPAQLVPPLFPRPKRPVWRAPLLFGLCGLTLALAGVAAWRGLTSPSPPRLSLAVLPFRYLGAGHNQDYLAEAIGDDLTADLSHIPGSIVIARESTAIYRGNAVDPTRIGRLLNVRYLVAGTVGIEGGTAHIDADLIDASKGSTLWSDRFDKPVASLSQARDAIVYRIASALHIALDNLEASRSQHDRPGNPDAQDLFFRARAFIDKDESHESYNAAQGLLEQAVAQQPDFGDAYAELAWLLMRKVALFDDPDDWAKAGHVIDRALELAPNNAKALAARGQQLNAEGKYKEAEATANAALQVDPNNIEALRLLANCAYYLGELQKRDGTVEQIVRLDPVAPMITKRAALLRGQTALFTGHPREAIDLLYESISGDPEPTPADGRNSRAITARIYLIAAYSLSGEQTKATELYRNYGSFWLSTWRLGATFPRAVAALPGAAAVLEALQRSGMPKFTDSSKLVAAGDVCARHAGNSALADAVNVRVTTTREVQSLLASQPAPLVIDLGYGAATVPGAKWINEAFGPPVTELGFVDRVVSDHADQSPVVIMANGPDECIAYDAVVRVKQKYHRQAVWYSGGEEAWAAAGQAFEDRRR
jgi:TolB-like protein/DNA-binding winged helix-turn-helix (wHTH) protein